MATDGEQTTVAKACRERKPNFSDAEIGLILEGIRKHRDLISNPETSTSINRQKDTVYRLITESVNEVTRFEYGGSVERNTRDVKKKWIELKYTALKIHNARLGENDLGTVEESKYVPKESPYTQLVLDIIFGTDVSGIQSKEFRGHNYNKSGPGRQKSVTVPSVSYEQVTPEGGTFGMGVCSKSAVPAIKTEAEDCLEHVHGLHHGDNSREVTSLTVKPERTESETSERGDSCKVTDVEDCLDSDYAEVSSHSQVETGKKQRERKQNFTEVEIATLLREVNKHKDVILMKDQCVEALKLKQQKWMQILGQCHKSHRAGVKRTVSEIQKKWRNLKLDAMRERKARGAGSSALCTGSRYTEQVTAILAGTFDDGPLTEVQEVDFEAMLNLDASSSSSTNQNQISLLKHRDSHQSAVLRDSAAAKKKQCGKAKFSRAEILCLLKEILKRNRILGKTLKTDRISRWKELHWQIITDKVNACSKRGVTRSWRDVQKKFKALKLAALTTKNQATSDESGTSQNASSYEYNRLVLDILKGRSTATKGYSGEDVEAAGTDVESNDKPQQAAETSESECAFPKRNLSDSATVSLEECECLVSEVDRLKDTLLASATSGTGVDDLLRGRQRRAWRVSTEKVNKCSARGFRWTARELKQKWLELRRDAERYQRAVDRGESDQAEPALFHTVAAVLQTLSFTSENTAVTASVPPAEAKKGSNSQTRSQSHVDTDSLSKGVSTPKHHHNIDKLNKHGAKEDGVTETETESLPNPLIKLKADDTVSDEDILEVDDLEMEDNTVDVDYKPPGRKHSERHGTARSSTARLRKSLNPQKFTRAPLAPAGTPNHRRVRSSNFSTSEVRIIMDVYEANKDVLNHKKPDSQTKRKKQRVWQCMVQRINAMNKSAGIS